MLQVGHIAVKQNGQIAYYRGVLRIGGAIIWECPHEHKWGTSAARHCAENYVADLGEHEPVPAHGAGGEGE
jgi:hypothetical protein